jgi:hypothetical protein
MELSEPAIVTPNDELIAAYSGNAGAAADRFSRTSKASCTTRGSSSPQPTILLPGRAPVRSCGCSSD